MMSLKPEAEIGRGLEELDGRHSSSRELEGWLAWRRPGLLLAGLLRILLLSFRAFLSCFGDKQLEIKRADFRIVGKTWSGPVELIRPAGGISPDVLLVDEIPAKGHVIEAEFAAEREDPALQLSVELTLRILSLRFEAQNRAEQENVEVDRFLGQVSGAKDQGHEALRKLGYCDLGHGGDQDTPTPYIGATVRDESAALARHEHGARSDGTLHLRRPQDQHG